LNKNSNRSARVHRSANDDLLPNDLQPV